MKYLIITNPNAGPKQNADEQVKKIKSYIEKAGHEVEIKFTEHEGHGKTIAKEALKSDVDVIVAFGGDGTVNEIGEVLVGSDKTLGIIPNGSGNGLARELSIPMEHKEATEVLLEHKVEVIDTGVINGEAFFVTCGVGFDGSVTKEFAESDTRGLTTYVRESLSLFFQYEPADYLITIDGKEVTATAFLVAVANASQYGNNAFIAPDASMSDGLLDVTVIKEFPQIEAAKIGVQLFAKDIDKNEYTSTFKGKKITIKSNRPVPYHLDGEPKDAAEQLNIEVRANSLKIVTGDEEKRERTIFDFLKNITNSFKF